MADRLYRLVTERAASVLLLLAAITAAALLALVDVGSGQLRLRLDPALEALLPDEDENARFYARVRRLFGSDEALILAFVPAGSEGVFTPEALARLAQITEAVQKVAGVARVTSLANALHLRAVDGDVLIEPFFERVPDSPDALETLRAEVLGNPLAAGSLVSDDASTAALVVTLRDWPESRIIAEGVDLRVLEAAERLAGDGRILLSGAPHVKAVTSRTLLRDLQRIIPILIGLALFISFLSFRSLSATLIPPLAVIVAMLWTLGVMSALGRSLNLVTVVVPPLILVIGFAYAVHVLAAYYEELRRQPGQAQRDAVRSALHQVALPTLLTGATTGAGFMALTWSPLGAIRQFGAFSTLGVLTSMGMALFLVPPLLCLLPKPRVEPEAGRADRLDGLMIRVARFDVRYRVAVLGVGAAVAVLGIAALSRVTVSTAFIGDFPAEMRVRRDFEEIGRRLGGAGTINVVVEAQARDAFKEPANLRAMQDLQTWLEAQPEIGATTSLVDYLMLINRAFHDDDPSAFAIPDTQRMVTQLLFFAANDEIEAFVDSAYQTLNIVARARAADSRDVTALSARVQQRLAQLPEHLAARLTGNTVLLSQTVDEIAWGQATSLLSAFGIIFLILSGLFTSLRVGFIALVPNVLPVVAYFGILGLTGVHLNMTTGLVACLVVGIAVDDTIHYLSHFNAAARRLASEEQGAIEALRSVGRPITFTSLGLCLGFLALTGSTLRGQVEFGALAATTLALAWLIDLTVTPAIAARMRIVSLWDVLTLDLGESPQQSIRLFRGLSKTQARIAALMTSVRTFEKGARVLRAGDVGEEMYVVIDGELAATVSGDDGSRVQLNVSKRGDVVGEVALFHGGERSADVEALSDVRVIRMTARGLERIRRRYPRTGAQLYRNLSQILAERLVRATDRLRLPGAREPAAPDRRAGATADDVAGSAAPHPNGGSAASDPA